MVFPTFIYCTLVVTQAKANQRRLTIVQLYAGIPLPSVAPRAMWGVAPQATWLLPPDQRGIDPPTIRADSPLVLYTLCAYSNAIFLLQTSIDYVTCLLRLINLQSSTRLAGKGWLSLFIRFDRASILARIFSDFLGT